MMWINYGNNGFLYPKRRLPWQQTLRKHHGSERGNLKD